jgi:hypothetical protein
MQLISKLREPNPGLAAGLKARLDAFDYPGLLDWLRSGTYP